VPFNPEQQKRLESPLDKARIHTRRKQGMELRYVEAFDVIDTANEIFGYHSWSYQLTKLETVAGVWIATVLLSVTTPDGESAGREDVGVGIPATPRGEQPSPDATETAIKAAVTDALKRALRTFGNAFGNSLYSKDDDAPGQDAGRTDPAPRRAATKAATETLSAEEQQPFWSRIRRYATDGGVNRDALNEYTKAYLHDTLRLEGWNLLTRAQWADFERAAAVYCGQEQVQTPPSGPNPMDVRPGPDGTWDAIGPDVPQDAGDNESACPTCGGTMRYKEGTNKAGKAYAGYFCADRNCKQTPIWSGTGGNR
jgi:DNA repair and recombination protein RAD52